MKIILILAITFAFVSASALSYNITESRENVYFAVLAYCPKKCLESWTCGAGKNLTGFTDVSHLNNDLTLASAYIGYYPKRNIIVLSFRGSANAENWIEDFVFDKMDYPCKGCQIHQGFMLDYLAIEQKINTKVGELITKHPTASILTTGHSMGAALSEISGLRLKLKFNRIVEVHNYGSPRIGNVALAQFTQTRIDGIFRLVHNRDMIPHLPPTPFQYHHSAFQVFFDQKFQNYKICSQGGEDETCSNKFAPEYSIGDHGFYFYPLDSILKC